MNMTQSKEILHKKVKALFTLFLLLFSVLTYASDNDIDKQIDKIINASPQEKKILIDELKNDISTNKYDKTETKKAVKSNKTIDEKIKSRDSKSIPASRCGSGKCGGGSSHGSKCGTGKCGMGN